ncbi:MAG: redoxin domain-containing protein [Roseibacillus sp.]
MKASLLPLLALSTALLGEDIQDQLDARKTAFEKRVTPEKAAENQLGVDTVRKSGMLTKALNVGDKAPDFTLQNATGIEVTLSALLKDGPVILTWYRGSWCPYCNLTLAKYQSRLEDFTAAGGQLIALTPELPDKALANSKELSLGFEVLTDLNNEVAKKYGTVFQMIPGVEQAMREYAGLKDHNGADYDEKMMPLSATYVIAPDRTITWAFLDSEYRNRATTDQITSALERLGDPEAAKAPLIVMRQFWEEVWNPPHNLKLIDTLVAKDFQIHTAGTTIKGPKNFKKWVENFQAKVPDVRFQIDDMFLAEDGERVITIWTCSGKNGGMFESKPDRRPIEFTGITITRVVDGQMTEKWVQRSAWELYQSSFQER